MSDKQKEEVNVPLAAMKEMLTAVLAEARKPADPTEEQQAALDQAQEMRREQGALVLLTLANKRREQENCIHMRRDGTTTAVYVANGNYMLDQQCQAKIRPGVAPEGYTGSDFYDTQLFNRLFQLSQGDATFA